MDQRVIPVLDAEIVDDLQHMLGARFSRVADEAIVLLRRYGAECAESHARNDGEALGRIAHRLRGGAAMIGALRVSAAAGLIETAAVAGKHAEAASQIGLLHDAIDEALSALRQYRDGDGT